MKKIFIFFFCLNILASISSVMAQRPMDKLSRSVVAQKVSNGVYVNWRITSDEWYNTSYKLYRDGSLIFTASTTAASNYLDAAGTINSKYTVTRVKDGIESAHSATASVLSKPYHEVPLRDIKKLGKQGYFPNDATAADLDGDGEYEIIIKRLNKDWSTANTQYSYFEAYKLDGTFMWAIDVGPNITSDVEINIAAFDFDGDGKAEVFMRTSDNTVFGLDINNQNGTSVGDRDGDGVTNYRYSIGGEGYMNAGPEYLSLIDGMTGKELDWTNFIARGNSNDWGDGYGHRANKFFFGAPYLDGEKPSLFIGRGIYTQTKMHTYDIVNKKLVLRWKFDSTNSDYSWQGNHNYTVADTDGDGKDEIVWGQMCVDDNGKGLYTTKMGHGDAIHVSDFDPYRKGIEVFSCLENSPMWGTLFRDGKTGQILNHHILGRDCGRCCAGNISDTFKGAELWGGGIGLSATDRSPLQNFGLSENFTIYWDGDLTKELLDHSGFSSSTGVGYGHITKFNGYGNISTLLNADAYSCNWSKGTPCLQADIMGDWREEAIWWRTDSMALRIYTTPHVTQHRIYTLMHDHQYRQAICWQMCGYNQPPHTSFYLGSDFPVPIPAKATNGKLVWKGNTAGWSTSAANFMDGDNFVGLIGGNTTTVPFANGKEVLFDTRGISKTVDISANLEPALLMVSGTVNYTIGGAGSLTGNMLLDKLGEGSLTLNGNHTYSGKTDVWEGSMQINGDLPNSPISVRRHAAFGMKGKAGKGITTEYNALLYVGGENNADTLKVDGNLNLVNGAKLVFDLSDNPNVPTGNPSGGSGKKNDFLQINSTLQLTTGSILLIRENADSLASGKYLIMKVETLTGSLSGVKIQGTGGKSVELSYDATTKELFLIVKGTRSSGKITWTGKADSHWNIAKSANWENEGFADIFVAHDSVYFDALGINRSINLIDSLPVGYMEVDGNLTYTIGGTGVLTGKMDLVKKGTGTLIINTRNNFTGKTIVESGILSVMYAPTETNNGGIGSNNGIAANLVVKDSAILQFNTANEITSRGLTLSGTAGGILNVPVTLTWNGPIVGTKLSKSGSGNLLIGSNNPSLNETVMSAGRIKLNTSGSVPNGIGKKITLRGGTLETVNQIGAYLSSSHAIEVPTSSTATVIAAARCEYNGALTGSGTLNWVADYIRAYINGNWSAFSGRINITTNSANSTYEDKFIVNTGAGFPNATINLGSGVKMVYKNGTADNGTNIIKIGMLTGVSGAEYFNAGLEVGGTNANGSYAGIISGVSNVKKVGSGLWILTGANTYSGATNVAEGTFTVNAGASIGTGTVTVANGALMNLNGTAGGSVVISAGGTMSLIGNIEGILNNTGTLRGTGTIKGNSIFGNNSVTIPGNTSIGTLNFGGNLTMSSLAELKMQISTSSQAADKLSVAGTLTCGGILNISTITGTPAENSEYQIFQATLISGSFTEINLPELTSDLEWDLSEIYTSGKIKVIKSTGIDNLGIVTGVLKNPSDGMFRILTGYFEQDLQVSVITLHGKTIHTSIEYSTEGILDVDLTGQPSGIYLLKLSAGNKLNSVLKLIKL